MSGDRGNRVDDTDTRTTEQPEAKAPLRRSITQSGSAQAGRHGQ